jgi:hypothetical protein
VAIGRPSLLAQSVTDYIYIYIYSEHMSVSFYRWQLASRFGPGGWEIHTIRARWLGNSQVVAVPPEETDGF